MGGWAISDVQVAYANVIILMVSSSKMLPHLIPKFPAGILRYHPALQGLMIRSNLSYCKNYNFMKL